jgi:hypothetical protein
MLEWCIKPAAEEELDVSKTGVYDMLTTIRWWHITFINESKLA